MKILQWYCGVSKTTQITFSHMYRSDKKVNKYQLLVFGPYFRTYLWKKMYSNIGSILTVAINGVDSIMKILQNMPKFGKKPLVSQSDMKRNKGFMYLFVYDNITKAMIPEELYLSESYHPTKRYNEYSILQIFICINLSECLYQ